MRRIIALLMVGILPLMTACALIPQEEVLPQMPVIQEVQENAVNTVAVLRGDLVDDQIFSASYQPINEEHLSFSETGQAIAAIYVQAGDAVKAGDLIAELDNTAVLQTIDAQQQTIASLNLQIQQQREKNALLQERINVLKPLAAEDASYNSRLTSAEQSLASGKKQIEYLNALLNVENTSLSELKESLKSRQLYAGMDGTVSYTLKMDGSTVYANKQLICSIQDLSRASFTAKLNKEYLKVGDLVSVRTDTKTYETIVDSVTPSEDQTSFMVTLNLRTPDTSLKAGASGRFTLIVQQLDNVLYLPDRAVHTQNGTSYVYYQDASGLIAVKEVVVGPKIDNCIQIISGLKEGELVII